MGVKLIHAFFMRKCYQIKLHQYTMGMVLYVCTYAIGYGDRTHGR